MDEVKAMLREILETLRQQQRATQRQLDGIENSITAIAKSYEQEDRQQERQERVEERERDKLTEDVADLKQRVEGLGIGLRDQPTRLLAAMDQRINEWRTAKYEAMQATGLSALPRDLTPAYGTQLQRREPTGRIAQQRNDEDITGVFDVRHTDGEKRALKELVGGVALFVWRRGGKWVTAIGSGGGIYHLLHKLGIL